MCPPHSRVLRQVQRHADLGAREGEVEAGGAVVGAGGGAVQGHQRTQLVHLGCDYEV